MCALGPHCDNRFIFEGHNRFPILFLNMPSRSISSSTTSPSFSHGPWALVNSNKHPVPTVPEPITSPGNSITFSDARASKSQNDQYISLKLPYDLSTPL